MAFRASSVIKDAALKEVKEIALQMKALAQKVRNDSAAGTLSASTVLNLAANIKRTLDRWAVLTSIAGLGAYAADQENDPTYDVVAEYTGMRNALTAVRDQVIADLPTATAPAGAVGKLAVGVLAADGSFIYDIYTAAQTANLRADLDAFIATVA